MNHGDQFYPMSFPHAPNQFQCGICRLRKRCTHHQTQAQLTYPPRDETSLTGTPNRHNFIHLFIPISSHESFTDLYFPCMMSLACFRKPLKN